MDRVDGFYHGNVTVARQPAAGDRQRRTGHAERREAGRTSKGRASRWRAPVRPRRSPRRQREPRQPSRDAAAARAAIERLVDGATTPRPSRTSTCKVALAEAAGRLEAKGAAPVLQAQLTSDPSVLVRTASLRGLQAMKAGDMSALMQTALADKDPMVRRAALALLPGLPITPAAKAEHLGTMRRDRRRHRAAGRARSAGHAEVAPSRASVLARLPGRSRGGHAGAGAADRPGGRRPDRRRPGAAEAARRLSARAAGRCADQGVPRRRRSPAATRARASRC